MKVKDLVDQLLSHMVDGRLTGNEQILDPALFQVDGLKLVETHDGSHYVSLTSGVYEEAQH